MMPRLFLLLFLFASVCAQPTSAVTDPARLRVDDTPAANLADLLRRSQIVATGWTDNTVQAFPTGRSVRAGRIVNFTQWLHVQKIIKGPSSTRLRLLSTGVEPLPERFSPLNQKYPGPLGAGHYLLFLQRVKGTDMYSITGLWQGVYPILQGRTIALEGSGFGELNGLTQAEVEQKLRRIRP